MAHQPCCFRSKVASGRAVVEADDRAQWTVTSAILMSLTVGDYDVKSLFLLRGM